MSSWRLIGREFHAFGQENEKLRSPNFSFNCAGLMNQIFPEISLGNDSNAAGLFFWRLIRYTELGIACVYPGNPKNSGTVVGCVERDMELSICLTRSLECASVESVPVRVRFVKSASSGTFGFRIFLQGS